MARRELVLAGDVGGTKTNLALFSVHGESIRPEWTQSFASKRYSGLVPVLQEFLVVGAHSIDAACFGIAGPVVDGKVKTPNLPWMIDSGELRGVLKLDSLALLNDLEAAAYGIFTLEDDEFCTLNQGEPRHSGNKALIAAGTGLGEAILHDDGHRFHPLASEGGHADFAPRDDLEIELLRYLMSQFGHVSYERVLSGPGLFNIYCFLKEKRGFEEPKWLADRLAAENDPSAVVSMAALANEAEICIKALDLFASIYGAEAGNLALRAKALRGLYVGGGIAPKILAKLQDGTFMRAFTDKGRYAGLLATIPVQVVLNDEAALRGAAYYAAFLIGD
ncbi:MAG: glucokinase [Deltaproteobacteria bacterium]|nr:glucokinase [Deltaproteobacteria bacterium]MBI2181804.1 glucokinase [Deltaproteobacteria bacterium]MBI2228520.1 glucokinase [Deltaproteobacteria bacterium]MBI3065883.1 glucokinase [Deltaproteobacteria bacterium]